MKKIFTLLSVIFASSVVISAENTGEQVLKSRKIDGTSIEQQIVKDETGRIYRKYTGKDSKIHSRSEISHITIPENPTFYESFEAYNTSLGLDWIPEGWTEINTDAHKPTEEMLSHNVNNTWYAYVGGDGYWTPLAPDGNNDVFIHFTYNGDYCSLAPQNEWLVTPTITPVEGDALMFNLAADFFNVYYTGDFDWSGLTYPQRRVVCNLTVMVSTDGMQTWEKAFDLAEDVCSTMTDREVYYRDAITDMYPYIVNIQKYYGKSINIAFVYFNDGEDWSGNSMIIDPIVVGYSEDAGIEGNFAAESKCVDSVYDLQGRSVKSLDAASKGLYIIRYSDGSAKKVVK